MYCLLQKIKKASSLPLVEQWEEYVVVNHSRFVPIDDKNFLEGTRMMAALGKVGSHFLQKEFRRDARRFLEDFLNCALSTVASLSVIGQGLSCFCTAIVVGGLVGTTLLRYSFSKSLWMGCWRKAGSEEARLRRAGLSTSPSFKNSGSWSGRPRGVALTWVTSCRSVLDRLVFVLVGTCIKYVS